MNRNESAIISYSEERSNTTLPVLVDLVQEQLPSY